MSKHRVDAGGEISPVEHGRHVAVPSLGAYELALHGLHVKAVLAPMEPEAVPAAQDVH